MNIENLKARLAKYGGHLREPLCERLKHSAYDCTCGWDDVCHDCQGEGGTAPNGVRYCNCDSTAVRETESHD